jgi:RHS repeat-associated protein
MEPPSASRTPLGGGARIRQLLLRELSASPGPQPQRRGVRTFRAGRFWRSNVCGAMVAGIGATVLLTAVGGAVLWQSEGPTGRLWGAGMILFAIAAAWLLLAGNVTSRKDARGITTTYAYDPLNRLTSKSYSDGTTPTARYGYDGNPLSGCATTPPSLGDPNPKGRGTSMCDGSGATSWAHDAAGRILAERRTIAGATEMISYGYNSDGTLKSITYPSGRTVAYTVGNAERPTAAVDGNGTNYAAGATYAPQGALASVVHGQVTGGFAGIAESYTYNNRLELASILANSSAGAALSLAYSFAQPAGNNGSVASITNNSDAGRTESLTYDPLDRVLTAQAQATSGGDCWGQSFGAHGLADDALGNLLSASVTKCTAPSLSVAVNGANQIVGFGYDAAGNMTADGQFTYTYDAENRITGSSAGVNYTYDGNDMRVEKSSGTLYWRAFSGDVLAETDTSGNTTKEYIYYAGRQIAWVDSSGNVYYEFADMLGSVRTVTDSSGSTCFDADYYPYGQELDAIPPSPTCSPTNRFTGYEYDAETGNYYAFFRYYSPRLGRFMTADPLGGSTGSPQSLNRYSYVANNPASFVDPLGLLHNLMPMPIGAGGGGGGGGGGGQFGSNWDEFGLANIPVVATGFQWVPVREGEGPWGTIPGGYYTSYFVAFMLEPFTEVMGSGLDLLMSGFLQPSFTGRPQGPAPPPQSPGQNQPLLVCAAETANQYSLAQLAGTNGKSGFFNSVANGVLGNTFSTVVSFAYGGSSTEFGTTAYDFGTKATESSLNAVTGAAPITDLGLGAESAGQIAEGVATEGLGGIFSAGKLIYDLDTFAYGAYKCR